MNGIIEVDLGDGIQRWVSPSGMLTRQRAEAAQAQEVGGNELSYLALQLEGPHRIVVWQALRSLDPKTPRRLVPAQRPPAGTPEPPWQLGGPVAGAGGGGT